jgi:hypothetical protein
MSAAVQWWTPEKIRGIMYDASNILHSLGVTWCDTDETIALWADVKRWLESKQLPRSPRQVAMCYLKLLTEKILRS